MRSEDVLDRLSPFLNDLRANLRLVDLIDIAVVAVFLYLTFLWLRRTASRAVLVTVTFVIGLYFVARTFDMYLTASLFQAGFTAIALGLILIFQEDLRRALEALTAWGAGRERARPENLTATVDTIVEAVQSLAERRVGALLVFPGRETLDRHIHGGVAVRGATSIPLLQSIFDPHSPGHDGAVLISGSRIDKLAVHLPLSENLAEVGTLGTRHAAALGLAERSDALVVVVSEERGTVSVAFGGRLEHVISGAELKRRLTSHYELRYPRPVERQWGRWLTENPGLKFASLALACLLWGMLAFRTDKVQRTFDSIPVEFRNVPENWALDEMRQTLVRVTLSGTERAFAILDPESLKVSLDMRRVEPGPQVVSIGEDDLEVPRGISVEQIEPSSVKVTAYRTEPVRVEVRPRPIGMLPESLTLTGIETNPATVLVRHSSGRQVAHVSTAPINLSEVRETRTFEVPLALPPGLRLAGGHSGTVEVTVTVTPKKSEASVPGAGR
jgi:uncharacterized protein (TIGR00159 family)